MNRRAATIAGLILLVALAALAHPAGAVDYYLWAGTTSKTMPDGASVPMWGFALEADRNFTTLQGTVSVPGPTLNVSPTETVVNIFLYNTLSVPVSLVIPGQVTTMSPVWIDDAGTPYSSRVNPTLRVRSFTTETAPGGMTQYTWTSFKPGSFIYQSGTHPSVQVQMGLYGAIKKDAATGQVYPGVPYHQELALFFSEIDPALHQAVAAGTYGTGTMTSTIDYAPKYFLINGAAFPDTATPLAAGFNDQSVLLRLYNAGLRTHAPMLQGLYMRLLSEDGNPYPYPKEQYSVILPAGKTMEAIIQPPASGTYALYDRALNLTNAAASPGGMLTYLAVDQDTDHDGLSDAYEIAHAPCTDPNISLADMNKNGVINSTDFNLFRNAYAARTAAADVNCNGVVNTTDFNLFRYAYSWR